MAKPIDPAITTILKGFSLDPKAVLWDCHGTWVMYHRALENVAAVQGITFDAPQVLEANGTTKTVALCVTGRKDNRSEWSIGEAAPGNNKNNYPYAMAEKRAKDRVILKLIGLHGLVYSEDEMDEKSPPPEPDPKPSLLPEPEASEATGKLLENIAGCVSLSELDSYGKSAAFKTVYARLPKNHLNRVHGAGLARREKLGGMVKEIA